MKSCSYAKYCHRTFSLCPVAAAAQWMILFQTIDYRTLICSFLLLCFISMFSCTKSVKVLVNFPNNLLSGTSSHLIALQWILTSKLVYKKLPLNCGANPFLIYADVKGTFTTWTPTCCRMALHWHCKARFWYLNPTLGNGNCGFHLRNLESFQIYIILLKFYLISPHLNQKPVIFFQFSLVRRRRCWRFHCLMQQNQATSPVFPCCVSDLSFPQWH